MRRAARPARTAGRAAYPHRSVGSVAAVTVDLATGDRQEIRYGTPEHEAHLEWARFHGIDPMTVPAGSEVVRDAAGCRVLYETYTYDPPEAEPDPAALVVKRAEDGTRYAPTVPRVSQGEAPPLPFPTSG